MRQPVQIDKIGSTAAGILLFSTLWIIVLASLTDSWSYPLDGYSYTGIARLEGFRLAQEGKGKGIRVPRGAMLSMDQVDLRMVQKHKDFIMPPADKVLSAKVEALLGEEADCYALTILDFTDPDQVRYVEHRATELANPGSVGKIVVALGIFQALADIYPDDVEMRKNILRNTVVSADEFIQSDGHKVPFWHPASEEVKYRPIQIGDRASLWTYLDWMLSASSNAAASISIRELMLMVRFGREYPVEDGVAREFFQRTPKENLIGLLARALQNPLDRNGLDVNQFRQGSLFTWKGKQLVPGVTSYANARELIRFLVKMEQGRLVDIFSSLEIKRLLYMTEGRIRYASSPALSDAAVYFKSGSLYKCKPEPDFKCRKYHGNVMNMMNSVTMVEYPAVDPKGWYMVVVMSNVLRKNSAVVHQTLATRVHELILSRWQ